MADKSRRGEQRPWLVGAAASVAVHVGVLTALLHRQETPPTPAAPTIELSLLGPARAAAEPRPARAADRPGSGPPSSRERAAPIDPGVSARPALPFPTAPIGTLPPGPGGAESGALPQPVVGERVRSALRLAGCQSGGSRLTAREGEHCQERLGAAADSPIRPPNGWAARGRDEAAGAGGVLNVLKSATLRPGTPATLTGETAIMLGVRVPSASPPPALPNIPASTLRGDDDALRPKPHTEPAEPPT